MNNFIYSFKNRKYKFFKAANNNKFKSKTIEMLHFYFIIKIFHEFESSSVDIIFFFFLI